MSKPITLKMTKVLIADDHQLIIDGVKALLAGQEAIEVVGEAHDGEEVLRFVNRIGIDLIIMDVEMPTMDGIQTCRLLAEKYPEIKVLILTQHNDADFIRNLAASGAQGYILKNTGKTELINAIDDIMNGQTHYGRDVVNALVTGIRNPKKIIKKEELAPDLTSRELEVLRLIAQEYTAHEIANRLFISQHTVDTHRKNLLSKVGVKNTAGLVRHAVKSGLVD